MSDRRQFITGAGLAAFTGLGALGVLYGAKRTWDMLPSVKAAGFTTIDVSAAQENVLVTEMWRGKPVFILRLPKDAKPASAPNGNDANSYDDKRLLEISGNKYLVVIGLCTHLGCIPAYFSEENKFKCACHGGEFSASGEVLKSPPPSPLVIPPFKIDGTKLVLGEQGPEYKKLVADGLAG